MKSKLRVFVMNGPEEVNGVTWWRMYRPLVDMHMRFDVEFVHNETGMIYPHHFLYCDLALVFRPYQHNHIEAMKMAKDAGVPIISDYDDNILNVPIGHGVWRHYAGNRANIEAAIAMSDQLWVSTPALKEQFGHPNTQVIPNALFEYDIPKEPAKHENVIAWRGSEMHREDLEFGFRAEYERLLTKIKTFLWIGYMPTWGRVEGKANILYETTWISTNRWLDYLRQNRLYAITKPLQVCPFNYSKSNIAWLEATAAGAVCISNYAGKQDQWAHTLRELPKNEDHRRHVWQESRDAIRTKYNLEQWNETRYRELLRTANGDSAGA